MRFRLLALIALVLGLSRMALSAEMSFSPKVPPVMASPAVASGPVALVVGESVKLTKRKAGRLTRLKRSWRERFVRRTPAAKPQVPQLPPPPAPLAFDVPSMVREAFQDKIYAETFIPGVTPPRASVKVSVPEPSTTLVPKPAYWSVEYLAASALAQTHDSLYRGDSSPQVRYRFRF